MVSAVLNVKERLKFTDFFCGIGGFHIAAENLGMKCVFASDIDAPAREMYETNFGIRPTGDISKIKPSDVPDHDILFAGFPCQPFSIIGKQDGFADPRGTLFFDLLKIIKKKMPTGIILENVKQLATSDKGRVIERILSDLRELGYEVDYKILNALDYGLPQKRERVIIVGSLIGLDNFEWPEKIKKMKPLSEILEDNPDDKFFVSERIRRKRLAAHTPKDTPSIWHENKSGNISSHPYSCALRAGASYNYLLVNGERRLTPRETLRLQGFPDSYKIVCPDSQVKKQTGNAVAVPVVQGVIERLKNVIERCEVTGRKQKTS
ncbi:MAG: DNA cytosine methyltransferase [Candidatus Anammoxibacter sp.]